VTPTDAAFDVNQMLDAPVGRVDAFGVGHDPERPGAATTERPEPATKTN
jgi:hypothetical protein